MKRKGLEKGVKSTRSEESYSDSKAFHMSANQKERKV